MQSLGVLAPEGVRLSTTQSRRLPVGRGAAYSQSASCRLRNTPISIFSSFLSQFSVAPFQSGKLVRRDLKICYFRAIHAVTRGGHCSTAD